MTKGNAPGPDRAAAAAQPGSPARVAELFAVATLHHQAGRLAQAEAVYREVLAFDPDQADCLHRLGVLAIQVGRTDVGVEFVGQAIARNNQVPAFHYDLGIALRILGRLEEAAASYRRAIRLKPDYVDAHGNLGNVLRELRMPEEAIGSCRRAIELKPDFVEAHSNLGAALSDLGKLDEAASSYRRAIELRPDYARAHSNLGAALGDIGRFDEALACCRRAIELRPDLAQAHYNLGNVLSDLGEFDEAIAAYRRAIELQQDFAEAGGNLLLCLNYVPDVSAEALLAEHRRWEARHCASLGPQPASHPNARNPDRRLRIGYVSGDFRNHPVGYFLAHVLAAHDRTAVEVFCYSNNAASDDRTAGLQASSDHWRDIARMSDDAAAAAIRQDGVDILVDLAGHTARNRLLTFARKPAPLQASWIGYPGTTGLSSIDYLLMDAVTVPPGAQQWCSEAVVRLPHGRFCYAPPPYAPAVASLARRNDAPVTFGSFNNLSKIGPEVIALWAEVLKAAPGSKLLLKSRSLVDPGARDRLADAFAAAGLAPERLELRGPSLHPQMLAEYAEIDIALDPFPFCGGLTSCEALWMGVPVVTLPGDRFASRQTLGFLKVIGVEELAAQSAADYVRIAGDLATDAARRSELRASLRPRMAASPLCDGRLFTRALEVAYRQMWRRWCAGEAAATFEVPAAG
jgi:predicted O-linked N-acetylglucosamine transferase (SPINDLY family)